MIPSDPLHYDFDLKRLKANLPSDWQLHYFAEIESTNDWALDRYRVQAPTHPALVLARLQSRGRGRAERSWQTAAGNLTCSLAFTSPFSANTAGAKSNTPSLPWPARIAIATALAVSQTARNFLPKQSCQIKWPNDLLVDGRKAAGILIESCLGNATGSDSARFQTFIIGIGINVNTDPTPEPSTASLQRGISPISIATASGKLLDLTEVFITLATQLASHLTAIGVFGHSVSSTPLSFNDAKMLAQFNQQLAWKGHLVSIRQASEEIQGQLEGLDQNGNLMLSTSHGPRSFAAGELRPLP